MFEEFDDDNRPHISKAEWIVMQDRDYFPPGGVESVGVDQEELQTLVERLRKTDYFKGEPESIFVDDISAPSRNTDDYRQWWEYHDAKDNDEILGDSPSPYELLYNDEFEKLWEKGEIDKDLYQFLKRMKDQEL